MEMPRIIAVNRLPEMTHVTVTHGTRAAVRSENLLQALHTAQIEPQNLELEPGRMRFLIPRSEYESVRVTLTTAGIKDSGLDFTDGTLISLVGHHLARDAGITAAVETVCRKARCIPIRLWHQQIVITLLVPATGADGLVKALHRDFVENPIYP